MSLRHHTSILTKWKRRVDSLLFPNFIARVGWIIFVLTALMLLVLYGTDQGTENLIYLLEQVVGDAK